MEKTEKLQVWVHRTLRQQGERPSGRLCRCEGPQKGGVGWVCLKEGRRGCWKVRRLWQQAGVWAAQPAIRLRHIPKPDFCCWTD